MTTLQERIGNERRRLRSVRQSMVAAIEDETPSDDTYVPFYVAIADYIDETMKRLHEQDVKMGNMIRDKVDEVDDQVEKALGELERRLVGAKAHLDPFLEARDALKDKGSEALDHFEVAAKKYSDFIVANMGHHDATTDLSTKLFNLSDWEYMAGITADQQAEEENLFQQVSATTPDSLKNISG